MVPTYHPFLDLTHTTCVWEGGGDEGKGEGGGKKRRRKRKRRGGGGGGSGGGGEREREKEKKKRRRGGGRRKNSVAGLEHSSILPSWLKHKGGINFMTWGVLCNSGLVNLLPRLRKKPESLSLHLLTSTSFVFLSENGLWLSCPPVCCVSFPLSSPYPWTHLHDKSRNRIQLAQQLLGITCPIRQSQEAVPGFHDRDSEEFSIRDMCFAKYNMHTNHLIILFQCRIWLHLGWSQKEYIFNTLPVDITVALQITCSKVLEDELAHFPDLIRSFFFPLPNVTDAIFFMFFCLLDTCCLF